MPCAVNINTVPVVWIEEIPLRSGISFSYLGVNVATKETNGYKGNMFSHNIISLSCC
jgi:hypothetical protein